VIKGRGYPQRNEVLGLRGRWLETLSSQRGSKIAAQAALVKVQNDWKKGKLMKSDESDE
jgi:hypothetical protein